MYFLMGKLRLLLKVLNQFIVYIYRPVINLNTDEVDNIYSYLIEAFFVDSPTVSLAGMHKLFV